MTSYGAECHMALPTTSSGIFMKSSPFRANLPLLLIQITTIVGLSKTLHIGLRRLGQPIIVSQLLAGLILGPSVMGRMGTFSKMMFPVSSMTQFNTYSMMCFCLLMFIIGVKTDFNMVWRSGKKVVVIGLLSNLAAYFPVYAANVLLNSRFPKVLATSDIVGLLSDYWSVSSFMVVASLLEELQLLNSKVGRMAISATLISDMGSYAIHRLAKSKAIADGSQNPLIGAGSFLSFLLLISFVVFIARPIVLRICHRTPKGDLLDEAYFVVIILLCLACGLVSEVIGHTTEVGMFLLGLALPSGPPLGSTLTEKMEGYLVEMGIPIFVANAGLLSDVFEVKDSNVWGYLWMLLILSFSGKVAAVVGMGICCNLELNNALAMGVIMAYKGLYDIKMLNNWSYTQPASKQSFSVIIFSILLQSSLTTPLIRHLYHPSHLYCSDKRRSVQHTKPGSELRVLSAVNRQGDVSPSLRLIHLIHAAGCTPICVYVLHLLPLTGQAAAILVPYGKRKGSAPPTKTDHIVNAFRSLEQRCNGYISVQPFVSISPYKSMHDDVCMVAMEKKVAMVILPFYKKAGVDGSVEFAATMRTMNANVLSYAPCSVGMLVSNEGTMGTANKPQSNSCQLLQRVVIYFIGGPDDREALSLAMHISENPHAAVAVIRFLPSMDWHTPGTNVQDTLDDELVEEFAQSFATINRVLYREETVNDVEDIITTIRSTCRDFDLVIVGRREGPESGLTAGLQVWSEYSELGVMGDMLASTDFENEASVLVVQQQRGIACEGRGGDEDKEVRIQQFSSP